MEKERKRKEKNRKIEKIYCTERRRRVLMLWNTRKMTQTFEHEIEKERSGRSF